MTDLLKLNEKSYIEYTEYELDNNEIEELREICYGYGTCLPLAEFFNDIGWIKQENYNKKQAYKDLAYLVQYIRKLEKDLKKPQELYNKIKEEKEEINNALLIREEYARKQNISNAEKRVICAVIGTCNDVLSLMKSMFEELENDR